MAIRSASPGTAVVVTGAASGIGAACARALAEAGRPVALWDRSDAAGVAAALAGATAMLDVSDGLVLDAARVAEASGVRIDLRSDALGPDPALALAGGEDHALLACFPDDSAVPEPFRVIGSVQPRAHDDATTPGPPHPGPTDHPGPSETPPADDHAAPGLERAGDRGVGAPSEVAKRSKPAPSHAPERD